MVDSLFQATGIDDVWSGFTGKGTSKDRGNAAEAALDATQWLTGMSKDYYGSTAPLRGNVINHLGNFMSGNLDPTASAQYGPAKMTAERQYNTARNQVISDTPTGGALYESLGNLGGQKANTMTSLIGNIIQDEYNKAYSMGQGSQTTAAAGVTGAANAGSQLLSALAQQQQGGAAGMRNALTLMDLIKNVYSGGGGGDTPSGYQPDSYQYL